MTGPMESPISTWAAEPWMYSDARTQPDPVAFYDNRTGILFSVDFLLPARFLIEDAASTAKAPCGLSIF